MKASDLLLWILRVAVSAVLITVGYKKLIAGDPDVALFNTLGMEPHGRVVIGVVEVAAGLLLLSPHAATGALLSVGVMLGAVIAHTTVLGFDVGGDGGRHVMLLALVLASSAVVLMVKRRQIPLVGRTLGGGSSTTP